MKRSQSKKRNSSNTNSSSKQNKQNAKQPRNEAKIDKDSNSKCDGCGRSHPGNRDACNFSNHPDFNKEGSWDESEIAKRTKEKLKLDTLCVNKKFNVTSTKFDNFSEYKRKDVGGKKPTNLPKKNGNNKGTCL